MLWLVLCWLLFQLSSVPARMDHLTFFIGVTTRKNLHTEINTATGPWPLPCPRSHACYGSQARPHLSPPQPCSCRGGRPGGMLLPTPHWWSASGRPWLKWNGLSPVLSAGGILFQHWTFGLLRQNIWTHMRINFWTSLAHAYILFFVQ